MRFFLTFLIGIFVASFLGVDAFAIVEENLDNLYGAHQGRFFGAGGGQIGGEEVRNVLIQVFRSIAMILYVISFIVAIYSTIVLLSGKNSADDFKKWRQSLGWSVVGILLLTIAIAVVEAFYDMAVDGIVIRQAGVRDWVNDVAAPIISILQYFASFAFLLVAAWGFYRMVFAAGDDGAIKEGRSIFINGIIGFFIIYFARPLVEFFYDGRGCTYVVFGDIGADCNSYHVDATGFVDRVMEVITWLNGFVFVVTVVIFIYAGFLYIFSAGSEEQQKRARRAMIYALVGFAVLVLGISAYELLVFTLL